MASKAKGNKPLFQATVAQLAGVLTVNGVGPLGQPEISILMRCKVLNAVKVGEVKQPGKGRPASIYDWSDAPSAKLGLEGAAVKDVSEATFAKVASPTGKGVVTA